MNEPLATLESLLNRGLFTIGSATIRPSSFLFVLLVLLAATVVSRLYRRWMRRAADRGAEANRPAYYAVGRLGHYLIVVVAGMLVLESLGINFASLAVVAGAIGIGVGLGLQAVVNNFVSGLILLFDRSLKVGDFVEMANGLQGTVQSINVRSTVLTTNDNLDVVVPNSLFTSGILTNWTMTNTRRRIHVPFGVAYGSNKELVRRAALEAAARVDATDLDQGQPAQVRLVRFGDSSLDFELVVWIGRAAVNRPGSTRAAYMWELETSLREYGIEIPFPQRDLRLRSGFESLRADVPAQSVHDETLRGPPPS